MKRITNLFFIILIGFLISGCISVSHSNPTTIENPNNRLTPGDDTYQDIYPFYEFIADDGSIITYHDIDDDTKIDYVDINKNGFKVRYTATSTNKEDEAQIQNAQEIYDLILLVDTYDEQ